MHPMIIVGSGLAAQTLIREFRKIDSQTPLMLICKDNGDHYHKPHLSTGLKQDKTADDLILTDSKTLSKALNVTILNGVEVTRIDPRHPSVYTRHVSNNDTVTSTPYLYNALVLACGAEPVQPKAISGLEHTHSINHWEDYKAFRNALDPLEAPTVTLLGAGLIGCEFANDLISQQNIEVHVVSFDKQVLPRLLPPEFAKITEEKLSALGVRWHLNQTIESVTRSSRKTSLTVTLASGKTIESDIVIAALGLKPNTGLAKTAGLKVHEGIVVDQHLQTTQNRIYALGDCAEINGEVRMFIPPIRQAAKSLARTLIGEKSICTFPPAPVSIKTPANPTCVYTQGISSKMGRWDVLTPSPDVKAVFLDENDQMHGFVLMGKSIRERMNLLKTLAPITSLG